MEAREEEKAAVKTKEANLDAKVKSAGAEPGNEEAFLQAKMAAMSMGEVSGDVVGASGSSTGGSSSVDNESVRAK
jgi:hypothetical protein